MMMIELLLSNGADINVKIESAMGYTVLMKLASTEILDKEKLINTTEIIQFLVERGADKNIKGIDGRTAFDVIRNSCFKDDILDVLRNTKQIHFYKNTSMKELNTLETAKINHTNKDNNDFYDANITKTNCCNICNIS
jgi:ankyrin repeat protein